MIGFAVFGKQPTAADVCGALDRAVERVGRAPRYTVTDQGAQFQGDFRAWCAKHRVRPRFGAIGRHGSIAVTERFIRSLKQECLRRVLVPLRLVDVAALIRSRCDWYDEHRPHRALGGATPMETYRRKKPAAQKRRLEPRARYPADGACAVPRVRARGRSGVRLELVVGERGLGPALTPVVHLRRAA